MGVPGVDISRYGVIVQGDAPGAVAGIVEKPSFEEAPSDMASIGRYILRQISLMSCETCLLVVVENSSWLM